MKETYEAGDVVRSKAFNYNNLSGGTEICDEIITSRITYAFFDDECGWRFWARPTLRDLKKEGLSKNNVVYFCNTDVVEVMGTEGIHPILKLIELKNKTGKIPMGILMEETIKEIQEASIERYERFPGCEDPMPEELIRYLALNLAKEQIIDAIQDGTIHP